MATKAIYAFVVAYRLFVKFTLALCSKGGLLKTKTAVSKAVVTVTHP